MGTVDVGFFQFPLCGILLLADITGLLKTVPLEAPERRRGEKIRQGVVGNSDYHTKSYVKETTGKEVVRFPPGSEGQGVVYDLTPPQLSP